MTRVWTQSDARLHSCKQLHSVMFYQVVAMPQYYPQLPSLPNTQPAPILLIAQALQQSLTQYQVSLSNITNDTTTTPPPLSEGNTTPLTPLPAPNKPTVRQDISAPRKTSEETIPSPTLTQLLKPVRGFKDATNPLSQVDKTLQLAQIPSYGLTTQQRDRKLQSLMNRKVAEFKMERGKRCVRSSYA